MAKKVEKNQTNVLKPAAISFLRKWRECLLTGIKKREDQLAGELQAAVPESFATWREEACSIIILNLIHHGVASRKYRRDEDEGRTYDYTDLEEFARRFRELKAAWKGIVRIEIFWEGDYKLEIFFTAV